MHELKRQATMMKESLLRGDIDAIGDILNKSWIEKKKTASHISNPLLENIYTTAIQSGATGGKVSGAGGGGFMFFYCPRTSRYAVEKALTEHFSGQVKRYEFTQEGLKTWTL
jgi:D-glycero-alpha-D-manno-heptose-7-phosphate kinase